MGDSTDFSSASRLLRGIEQGGLAVAEARVIATELDPVLLHTIVRYLRDAYPATVPEARPVLERLVAVTESDRSIVREAKLGEEDPIGRWIVEEYRLADFKGRSDELLHLVIDKLES